MIRLTADQLYYQHRVLCLRSLLWPLGEFSLTKTKAYFKIDGLWPNTTATGLLARDREYFWIRLQPSFRVACQRGGSYGWKRCVVEWSIVVKSRSYSSYVWDSADFNTTIIIIVIILTIIITITIITFYFNPDVTLYVWWHSLDLRLGPLKTKFLSGIPKCDIEKGVVCSIFVILRLLFLIMPTISIHFSCPLPCRRVYNNTQIAVCAESILGPCKWFWETTTFRPLTLTKR